MIVEQTLMESLKSIEDFTRCRGQEDSKLTKTYIAKIILGNVGFGDMDVSYTFHITKHILLRCLNDLKCWTIVIFVTLYIKKWGGIVEDAVVKLVPMICTYVFPLNFD